MSHLLGKPMATSTPVKRRTDDTSDSDSGHSSESCHSDSTFSEELSTTDASDITDTTTASVHSFTEESSAGDTSLATTSEEGDTEADASLERNELSETQDSLELHRKRIKRNRCEDTSEEDDYEEDDEDKYLGQLRRNKRPRGDLDTSVEEDLEEGASMHQQVHVDSEDSFF